MNKQLEEDFVVVKPFPGATTACMQHYSNPSLARKPETVILHVGTNDLSSTDSASQISNNIIKLAKKCEKAGAKVMISSLVCRGDQLNGKVDSVNDILRRSCQSRNIGFIDHNNINLNDLNGSKIHMKKSGDKKMTENFIYFIKKA